MHLEQKKCDLFIGKMRPYILCLRLLERVDEKALPGPLMWSSKPLRFTCFQFTGCSLICYPSVGTVTTTIHLLNHYNIFLSYYEWFLCCLLPLSPSTAHHSILSYDTSSPSARIINMKSLFLCLSDCKILSIYHICIGTQSLLSQSKYVNNSFFG